MTKASLVEFGPFRFDTAKARLWRGTELLPLSAKAIAVLDLLVQQAGQLVLKETLLEAVWPDVTVGDAVLAVSIRALRHALGDSARLPHYIQTVHRRGYRFIAPVSLSVVQETSGTPVDTPLPEPPLLVGRDRELAQLQQALTKALRGERQVVFVTGEPGLGKTVLVDTFLYQNGTETALWVARGQCLDQAGAGEAYLSVLDALGQLCRQPGGARVLDLLERYAPTWLVHLPAFLDPAELEALRRKVYGTTPERMLREFAEVLEALTAERPLLLVLEDLHWSDAATVDLVAWLARRRQPARLLLVGTYRPVEVIMRGHPLREVKQELELHRLCTDLPLELLNEAEVEHYLSARFGGQEILTALTPTLYRQTGGNPLFMVTVVDSLLPLGTPLDTLTAMEIAIRQIPESLRGMIGTQLGQRRPEERQTLEIASVMGVEFTAALVAAVSGIAVEEIEACCAGLVQRSRFLQESDFQEYPDGTVTACYRFRHALYQQTVYEQMAASQRLRLHRQIGEQLETMYGAQATAHAAELARHFEQGRDASPAIKYLRLALTHAMQRRAYQDALGHLESGLALLHTMPETPERCEQELDFQITLGHTLMRLKGDASAEAEQAFARAWDLSQQGGTPLQRLSVSLGRSRAHRNRAEYQKARLYDEECLRLTLQQGDPALVQHSYGSLGIVLCYLGLLSEARETLQQGLRLHVQQAAPGPVMSMVIDPEALCHAALGRVLWLLGYPDQARQQIGAALAIAQREVSPICQIFVRQQAAAVAHMTREVPVAATHLEDVLALTTEHAFPFWQGLGQIMMAWTRAMQDHESSALTQLRQGLEAVQATGMQAVRSWCLGLLAEVAGHVQQPEVGLAALRDALAFVERTDERFYEAELYRLQGELLLQSGPDHAMVTAAGCFQQALTVARRQQARSWELRAAMSLSRLWWQQNEGGAAYQLLSDVYNRFGEGFDTADLQDARALLDDLAS